MSNTIAHKLLHIEIPAPEKCWEQIATELDDSAIGFQFPAKLNQLCIPAPQHCWDNISRQLSATQDLQTIAAKLASAEVNPPGEVWNAIVSKLDNTNITLPGRRFSVLRYAAAAAIISVLILAGIKLLGPNNDKKQDSALIVTVNPQRDKKNNSQNTVPTPEETTRITHKGGVNDEETPEATKNTYARLDAPARKKKKITSQFELSKYIPQADFTKHTNTDFEEPLLSSHTYIAGRYALLMTPDGYFIRMSKKLSDLVCCVTGEEVDEKCKTQMDTWRKQLAYSNASHPGNFIDILKLVQALQNNQ